jgi:hypothetical protein
VAVDRYELSALDQIEEKFRGLLQEAELPEPDEVQKNTETGELTFRWHERKLEIVVGPEEAGSGSQFNLLSGPNGSR